MKSEMTWERYRQRMTRILNWKTFSSHQISYGHIWGHYSTHNLAGNVLLECSCWSPQPGLAHRRIAWDDEKPTQINRPKIWLWEMSCNPWTFGLGAKFRFLMIGKRWCFEMRPTIKHLPANGGARRLTKTRLAKRDILALQDLKLRSCIWVCHKETVVCLKANGHSTRSWYCVDMARVLLWSWWISYPWSLLVCVMNLFNRTILARQWCGYFIPHPKSLVTKHIYTEYDSGKTKNSVCHYLHRETTIWYIYIYIYIYIHIYIYTCICIIYIII